MQQLSSCLDRHPFPSPTVFRIPNDRMSKMRHRRADLMQETGLESNLDEGRVREGFDRCHTLSTRMSAGCHFDVGGMMTLDHERQMDLACFLESPDHESEIGLVDAMFAERAAQTFPDRLVGREQKCARRIDIEPMDDPRAKTPLSDSDDFFVTRDHRIQNGVILVRP